MYSPHRHPISTNNLWQIQDVLNHYEAALASAEALDARIASDSSGYPSEYYSLLSLATRQAMGVIEYTLVADSSGQLDQSDIKAFSKDLGTISLPG